MTPAARIQAAVELVDEIIASAREGGAAADTLIARYFKARRYAGAKDRRAVRELVYGAVRRAGERPPSGRSAMLGLAQEDPGLLALFDGSPHGPATVREGEAAGGRRLAPTPARSASGPWGKWSASGRPSCPRPPGWARPDRSGAPSAPP